MYRKGKVMIKGDKGIDRVLGLQRNDVVERTVSWLLRQGRRIEDG